MRAYALFLAAAMLALAPYSPAEAQVPETFACSISINYTPGLGAGEIYQHDFLIAAGGRHRDDASSATRQHILNVNSIARAHQVLITADYFSDVSPLAATGTAMTLMLRKGGGRETATGKHHYIHSINGSYTVTYTFQCQRKNGLG